MKLVVGNRVVLSRTPEGPVAPHLGSFAEFIIAQGYALDSLRRQVHLAACFSDWLEQQRVTLDRLTPDHAKQYLQHRVRHLKPARGDVAALQHLIEFLRGVDLVPAETPPQLPPVERCTEAYVQYLREVQGLAEQRFATTRPSPTGF
jgi:hypothetical protein